MNDSWMDVMALEDVFEGEVMAVNVQGKEIALYEVQGELYATDNLCTHGAARLSDGFLEGREIECPFHQGRFDVCTGKALCAPLTENIRVYPVRIENKRVFVNMV
ncbi:MAG: non-heme iron oxygenase ferredoxin subunit [Betaproteobacteria bacterium]|jgi:naphthalene 1,2-dioxygenase system ferredoxin subunit|nr:non-heme iron oxygenase ferredoxin subunit [Burkholderiaceae bacterium]NCV63869.1 non-heme iron oxygenase ferredoxin subunit [Betaproteobacteria bacterium]